MSAVPISSRAAGPVGRATHRATHDTAWVRWTLTGLALLFVACFLVLPLAAVFTEALRRGVGAYFSASAAASTVVRGKTPAAWQDRNRAPAPAAGDEGYNLGS